MEAIFRNRWFHPAALIILAVGILLAYSNTFYAGFQFDDMPQIIENPQIQSLDNLFTVLKGNRGVTLASLALNYAFGGQNVFGYHVVNTVIHILNSVGVYFLIFLTLNLLKGDEAWSKKIAVFSSLLFALHPVQTQAVTYIIQRMESLSSLFYIAALLFFIFSARASTPGKRAALYAGVAISYILGFYSKESAITLPAIILLYDFYFTGGGSIKKVASRWPLYAVLVLLLIFFAVHNVLSISGVGNLAGEPAATEVKKNTTPPPGGEPDIETLRVKEGPSAGFGVKSISPKEYLLTQFNVLTYYLSLLILPVNQNLDYDFPVARGLFAAPAAHPGTVLNLPVLPPVISLVILLAIITLSFRLLMRSQADLSSSGRVVSFFIFWFFIILSPTSSIVPIVDVIYEHRLYLPSVGFFVISVIFVDYLSGLIFSRPRRA